MALLDFLKKKSSIAKAKEDKKETEKSKKPAKSEKVSVKKEDEPKVQVKKEPSFAKASKGKGFSYEVVKEPHISEKSTILGEQNKYVFKVYERSNKPELKRAIEGIYGVNVVSVNIIKIPKKRRRLGRTEGFRKGYVKAVVTIREGQKIEIF